MRRIAPQSLPQAVTRGLLVIALALAVLASLFAVPSTVESAAAPDSSAFSTATTTTITNTANTLKVRDDFNPATAGQRFMRVKVDAAP